MDVRSLKSITLSVSGQTFQAELVEIPFREGVELRCTVLGELERVSDRGLGEAEAIRLMELLIEDKMAAASA